MKELQVPFDSAWILKNRRKIKKALLADGTTMGFSRLSISRNMPVIGRMPCLKIQSWKLFSQT